MASKEESKNHSASNPQNRQPPPITNDNDKDDNDGDDNNALLALDTPSEVSLEEYRELVDQIKNELSIEECQTELLDGARYDDIDVVRALLKCHGSNPDFVNHRHSYTGNTALHMAAANGHLSIVKLLLSLGKVDVSLANAKGNTALHWAATNGQDAVVKLLLNQSSQDVLKRNDFGRSALTEGFSSQNEAVIQTLLEHESASEERLMETRLGNSSKDASGEQKQADSITHRLLFGGSDDDSVAKISVQIRELAMAKTAEDSILGQESPDQDTTGFGVWAASLVCAQWMARLFASSSTMQESQQTTTILELGAGCGVPGLTVARAFSAMATVASNLPKTTIYLTDFNNKTVENLQYNISLNDGSEDGQATENLKVIGSHINWHDASTWPEEKMDIIIGSDLIYQQDMVEPLVRTLCGLLKPGSGCFYYVAPDTGRQGQDVLWTFLKNNSTRWKLLASKAAPEEYMANPLASQDDEEAFLHFSELQTSHFVLHHFQYLG